MISTNDIWVVCQKPRQMVLCKSHWLRAGAAQNLAAWETMALCPSNLATHSHEVPITTLLIILKIYQDLRLFPISFGAHPGVSWVPLMVSWLITYPVHPFTMDVYHSEVGQWVKLNCCSWGPCPIPQWDRHSRDRGPLPLMDLMDFASQLVNVYIDGRRRCNCRATCQLFLSLRSSAWTGIRDIVSWGVCCYNSWCLGRINS